MKTFTTKLAVCLTAAYTDSKRTEEDVDAQKHRLTLYNERNSFFFQSRENGCHVISIRSCFYARYIAWIKKNKWTGAQNSLWSTEGLQKVTGWSMVHFIQQRLFQGAIFRMTAEPIVKVWGELCRKGVETKFR